MNDYDFGFQFSFEDKGRLIYWEGATLKHHILYNLKQKKYGNNGLIEKQNQYLNYQ